MGFKDYLDRQCDRYYLDLEVLTRVKVDSWINQLIREDVTIYSLVVGAFSVGVAVEIESRIFSRHFTLRSHIPICNKL